MNIQRGSEFILASSGDSAISISATGSSLGLHLCQ